MDINNSRRVIRALSIIEYSGKTYSSFKTGQRKTRNFEPIFIQLDRERNQLYQRINFRVNQMMEQGLLDEAKALHEHQGLKALNTVGYKELFEYLDGKISLNEAVDLIKRNSRRYAKRQLTWFNEMISGQNFIQNLGSKFFAYSKHFKIIPKHFRVVFQLLLYFL